MLSCPSAYSTYFLTPSLDGRQMANMTFSDAVNEKKCVYLTRQYLLLHQSHRFHQSHEMCLFDVVETDCLPSVRVVENPPPSYTTTTTYRSRVSYPRRQCCEGHSHRYHHHGCHHRHYYHHGHGHGYGRGHVPARRISRVSSSSSSSDSSSSDSSRIVLYYLRP